MVSPGGWPVQLSSDRRPSGGLRSRVGGEKIEIGRKEGQATFSFFFPHPLENLTLIAGHRLSSEPGPTGRGGNPHLFLSEDENLAPVYIQAAKRYLRLYERLLGYILQKILHRREFFAHRVFHAHLYPPGQGVVRLPFILETSLGHEILHQWFGNLVYVDYGKGNWAEGLTTYLADHFYEEEKGKGFEYRKGALIDYQSYVTRKDEIPLKHFRGGITDLPRRSATERPSWSSTC